MNFITNILYIFYVTYLLGFSNTTLLSIFIGVMIPYIALFLRFKNRYFHSLPTLFGVSFILSLSISAIFSMNLFSLFTSLIFGITIHLSTDILRSKPKYILYPFVKKSLHLSLIDYFDPVITLLFSLFMLIFSIDSFELPLIIKFLPMVITLFYVLFKFISKYRLQKIYKDSILDSDQLVILPGLTPFLWRVIIKKENSVVVYIKHILKKEFLSIRYFNFTLESSSFDILKGSKYFNSFKKEYPNSFIQDFKVRNRRFIRVYDINNFISLFKKEQVFLEIEVDSNFNIIKERVVL